MLDENEGAYQTRRTLMRNEMFCLLWRAPYLGKTLYYFSREGGPSGVQRIYSVAAGLLCAGMGVSVYFHGCI
jgi:hypothetical protein